MKTRHNLVAYGAVPAVILGGGIAATEAMSVDTPTLSDVESTNLHVLFEEGRQHWIAQGIGKMATIKLVELSDDTTYTCPASPDAGQIQTEYLTSGSSSEVCASLGSVVITALGLHSSPGGAINLINHELGHFVELYTGQYKGIDWSNPAQYRLNYGTSVENGADCYGGAAIAAHIQMK